MPDLRARELKAMSEYKIYLVGGAVRDSQLGLVCHEKDWVVVGASPQQLLSQGYKAVGKDFPVFLHPDSHEEYALARTERKIGQGYYGFECYFSPEVTLEEDLMRRDLTINAMAKDLNGDIIDPYGGQKDLAQRLLRHVSAAFSEDPLRILRIARFMARFQPLGFSIAPETLSLMKEMVVAGEVEALVAERVWKEMQRALGEAAPVAFFETLRDCGALERLWPALNKLWGVPQPATWHPEIDTGVHVMMALSVAAQLSPDTRLRFAVLCHDLGKGLTPHDMLPHHRGHEETGVALVQEFCRRYRVPNEYRDLAIHVSRFHTHCHKVQELRSSTLLTTLERLDAFRKPEQFELFLLACEADARGRLGLENRPYPQSEFFRQAYQVAKAVPVQPMLEKGLQGLKLGDALHQARAKAIDQALKI
jgi:tRNA nucleotidyltransferase (CCA-adding enzyme)